MRFGKRHPVWMLSIGALALAIAGAVLVWLFVIRPERELYTIPVKPPRSAPADWAEEVIVAVLGDSWVADKKLDASLAEGLAARGMAAKVRSTGHSGAKSRHIAMTYAATEAPARDTVETGAADYAVLVVGVNDVAGHVGPDRYRHHVEQLLDAIERDGIHPVLVELPEFGIEQLPSRSLISDLKLNLFRFAFDGGKQDVIERYRDELHRAIADRIETGAITFVDFDCLCHDYEQSKHLFRDPSHLNELGSTKLAEIIAECIAATHKRRLAANVDVSDGAPAIERDIRGPTKRDESL